MSKKFIKLAGATLCGALSYGYAHAYTFATGIGDMQGSWVSNITGGLGIRTKNPSCSLTGDPNANGCGSGANTAQWANGDDGDLNYRKGKPFTTYLSATSELLLTMPSEGYKFLVRGTGMYDFMAKNTERTDLSSDAKGQIVHNVQLLDLWVEKDFQVGEQLAHVRIGNQALNWGESYFASNGINATNSVDIQKLLIPGTQIKQALLPAPMISFASNLPDGFSTEAYWQWQWNSNKYPPVGSFWSASDVFGRGQQPGSFNATNFNIGAIDAGTIAGPGRVGITALNQTNQNLVNGAYTGLPTSPIGVPYTTVLPGNEPQYGVRIGYNPRGIDANFGFYYEHYTDKSPVLSYLANGASQWSYVPNRQLFGVSTNFPLGDWAIGAELSYRPHDAVAMSGCFIPGGPTDYQNNLAAGINCPAYRDFKKYQFDVNAQLNLTKTTYPFLKLIAADSAVFTAELTWINYPGVSPNQQYFRTINGQTVYQVPDAGYNTWLQTGSGAVSPIAAGQGTANSVGLTADFNWTYDGSLIPGWQVTPGITFYDAVHGYTPTFSYNYAQGAKSINLYLLFNQNPAVWQAGLNFTMFFGGNALSQIYGDRNFAGVFLTRNF